jgi:hypothetical protein
VQKTAGARAHTVSDWLLSDPSSRPSARPKAREPAPRSRTFVEDVKAYSVVGEAIKRNNTLGSLGREPPAP